MAVSVSTIAAKVMSQLNDNTSYIATSVDPKRLTQYTLDMCEDIINDILGLIASVPGHPDQIPLSTESSALDNDVTTTTIQRVGDFIGCRVSFAGGTPSDTSYYVATMRLPQDIERYRQDVTTSIVSDGGNILGLELPWYAYSLADGRLYHTGTKALLRYIAPADENSTMPTSFDKYAGVIFDMALARLLPFMGATDTAAQHYLGMAEAEKQRIMSLAARG